MRNLIIAILAVLMSGCANTIPPKSQTIEVEVTPSMRNFVLATYQGVIKRRLKSPASAQFAKEPDIVAKIEGGEAKMTAIGEVDAQNSFGALLHSTYLIHYVQPIPSPSDATRWAALPDNWTISYAIVTD